jgi:hypothetical protein
MSGEVLDQPGRAEEIPMATLSLTVPVGLAIGSAVKDPTRITTIASSFGSRVAEAPILDRMRADGALGAPGDFGLYADKGNNDSDPEMFTFIALRNNLPRERITEMRNYRAVESWSRPDALVHTRTVREYYEIKPESAGGITGGQLKLPNIDRFMTRFSLPYRAGRSYLPGGLTDEAPLLENNVWFQQQKQSLQTMSGVRNIRLFIHWDRPDRLTRPTSPDHTGEIRGGLIIYRAKVTFDTDEPAPREIPQWMHDFANCVVLLGIQAVLPGTFPQLSATNALNQGLVRLREPLNELKRNLQERVGLHRRLLKEATPSTVQKVATVVGLSNPATLVPTLVNIAVNPAMRPVVGAAVQTLNPAKHTLEIWKQAQDALTAAEAAWQARNFVRALTQFAIAEASFARASEQLEAFQKGTELAARRAEVIVKVSAALAVLAAVVVYSAPAVAAGGAQATAVAEAAPEVRVRVAQFLRVSMEGLATAESTPTIQVGVEAIQENVPKMAMQLVMRGASP